MQALLIWFWNAVLAKGLKKMADYILVALGYVAGDTIASNISRALYSSIKYAVILGLLWFAADFIIDMLRTWMQQFTGVIPNLDYLLCWFGIYDALNAFIPLYILGWLGNKFLNFTSSNLNG